METGGRTSRYSGRLPGSGSRFARASGSFIGNGGCRATILCPKRPARSRSRLAGNKARQYNLRVSLRTRVGSALPERVVLLIRAVLNRPGQRGAGPALVPCPPLTPGRDLETIHATRESLAKTFLKGTGIEIGALHQPLSLP